MKAMMKNLGFSSRRFYYFKLVSNCHRRERAVTISGDSYSLIEVSYSLINLEFCVLFYF